MEEQLISHLRDNADNGEETPFLPVPCLICGQFVGVKAEMEEDGKIDGIDLDLDCDSFSLLHYFFKLFRVKLGKGWKLRDVEVGNEKVPVCLLCLNRLRLLKELQTQLEELTEQIRNGKEELTAILECSEESLQKQGVYQRDGRYYRIRRQILGGEKVTLNLEPSSGRTSTRNAVMKKAEEKVTAAMSTHLQLEECVTVSTSDEKCVRVKKKNRSIFKVELSISDPEEDMNIQDHSNPFVDLDYETEPPKKLAKIKVTNPNKKRPSWPKKLSNSKRIAPSASSFTKSESLQPEQESLQISDIQDEDEIEERPKRGNWKGRKDEDFIPFESDCSESEPLSEEEVDSDSNKKRFKGKRKPKKQIHDRVDMPDGRVKCLECDRIFGKNTFERHRLRMHGTEEEKAKFREKRMCPDCGKFVRHLADHQKRVHGSEEEKARLKLASKICPDCGKQVTDVESHRVRLHGTEEEKVKYRMKQMCPECGICFANLKDHMEAIHSSVRKYSCQECGKSFKMRPTLNQHVRNIHKKVARHKCTLCPKTFFTKTLFEAHTRTHFNIRPFKCELCSIAFNTAYHLRRHNGIYHEEGSTPKRGPFIRGKDLKDRI